MRCRTDGRSGVRMNLSKSQDERRSPGTGKLVFRRAMNTTHPTPRSDFFKIRFRIWLKVRFRIRLGCRQIRYRNWLSEVGAFSSQIRFRTRSIEYHRWRIIGSAGFGWCAFRGAGSRSAAPLRRGGANVTAGVTGTGWPGRTEKAKNAGLERPDTRAVRKKQRRESRW